MYGFVGLTNYRKGLEVLNSRMKWRFDYGSGWKAVQFKVET